MKRLPNNAIDYLCKKFSKNPITYKTAFIIVVVLHVCAYGSLVAFSKYRESVRKAIVTAKQETYHQGPYSDALKQAWPTDNLKPKVIAKSTPKSSPAIKPIAETTKAVPKSTPKAITLATQSPEPAQKVFIKPIEETQRSVVSVPKPTPQSISPVASIKPVDEAPKTVSTPIPTPQGTPVVASVKLDEKSLSLTAQIPPRSISEQKPSPNHLPPDMEKSLKEIAKEIQKKVDNSSINERTHTIQPGENLYIIAHKMETSYHSIMAANNIKDPRELRVGQVLKIPRKHSI